MTDSTDDRSAVTRWFDTDVLEPMDDFHNPRQEWRRLFSECFGTFLLVLRGRGGGRSGSAAGQGDLFTETDHPDPTPT